MEKIPPVPASEKKTREREAKNVLRCPFYLEPSAKPGAQRNTSRQTIYCEGVFPGGSIHAYFVKIEDKIATENRYCRGRYQTCPIARMLFQKYGYEEY